jgi:outer membrane immunogenic protein
MKRRFWLLGAVAACLLATPAFADDEDFTGGYVGAEVGYSHAKLNVPMIPYTEGSDGVYYGGFVGYRYQSAGGFVIGAEAFGGSDSNDFVFDLVNVGRILGVDAVLGYATGRVLIFGDVGYVNGKLTAVGFSETDGTVRYGGGVEVRLAKNVSGRIKATMAKFKKEGVEVKNTTATAGVLVEF